MRLATASATAEPEAPRVPAPDGVVPIEPMRGPAKTVRAEQDILWVRFAIIAFNIAAYYLLMDPAGTWPGLAAVVTFAAGTYAVVMLGLRAYLWHPFFLTTGFTVATDSVLIFAWLLATGGLESPFAPLWIISLVAVAFRFGPRATIAATGLYVVGDLAMLAAAGDLATSVADMAARSAYIVFGGALGALLARDSIRAHGERADATQRLAEERTQMALARQEEAQWKLLSEASLEGVAVHRDGIIVACNRSLCTILDRPRDQVIGLDVRDIVAAGSRTELASRLAAPRTDAYELDLQRPGGEIRRVQVQARDTRFQGHPARVTSVRDITDQREAERARQAALEQQHEIDRLQEIDRFKTDFINAAAHELNTPMTPLLLQLHVVRGMSDGGPHQGQAIDILERNLRRLSRLVDDMLDVARLENRKMRFMPSDVDVAALAQSELETFRAMAKEKNITLEVAVPDALVVHADPMRISQVLSNLLSNAIKFTPEGGVVGVAATTQGDAVMIDVQDTGRGLTVEQSASLFRPFSRPHGDDKIPGTGLGLYISRSIAEQAGGELTCHSDGPGRGATFRFSLPARGQPEALAGAEAS